jgi:hypothetical protein
MVNLLRLGYPLADRKRAGSTPFQRCARAIEEL